MNSQKLVLRYAGAAAIGAFCTALIAGCPGNPQTPNGQASVLAYRSTAALIADGGANAEARARGALLAAAQSGESEAGLMSMVAALDEFAYGRTSELGEYGLSRDLADRLPPDVAPRILAEAKNQARGLNRALLAMAARSSALEDGDTRLAAALLLESGCVQNANITTSISSKLHQFVSDEELRGHSALAGVGGTVGVRGYGCDLPLTAASARRGTRLVQFTVQVPDTGKVYMWLNVNGAARVRAGSTILLDRNPDAGNQDTYSFARAEARAGTHLITIEAAMADTGDTLAFGIVDAEGHALETSAPAQAGAAANGAFTAPLELGRSRQRDAELGDDERITAAAFAIAVGDYAHAEGLTEGSPGGLLTLLHARAIAHSHTLPEGERSERIAKDAERLNEAMPNDPRSVLWQLRSLSQRKSAEEAPFAGLALLKQLRAAKSASETPRLSASPELTLVASVLAMRAGLDAEAERTLASAKLAAGGTRMFRDAELLIGKRSPQQFMQLACSNAKTRDYNDKACKVAYLRAGMLTEQRKEAARLRRLAGTPNEGALEELSAAVVAGDTAAARAAYATMLPGERSLAARFVTSDKSAGLSNELRKLLATADSNAITLAPLLAWGASTDTTEFDKAVEAAWAQERTAKQMPGAPTAVLLHRERYEIDAAQLLHFTLFDLRRVSGTTDVEQNAQAMPPMITGVDSMRVLRRRILKPDGRIITPHQAPGAAQAHADLAQLEAGDLVESLFEGYAAATDNGFLGLDSPDLLPSRTAVLGAEIQLVLADGFAAKPFAHPLLGKPEETRIGSSRSYRYVLKQSAVRRLEEGTPAADRDVGISLQTATYSSIAGSLRDHFAGLADDDRDVRKFAAVALAKLGSAPSSSPLRARLEALTIASSEAITEASAASLSDWNSDRSDGDGGESARSMLLRRQGSRTWVLHRALTTLGIRHELRLAERSAFTKKMDYPAHVGRFVHPILAVFEDGATQPILIDADVQGPALPPGHVSPELSGLQYLVPATGQIALLPVSNDSADRDEIDLRLTLDAAGNAKGQLTILLRGRASQDLAEALVRVVGSERDQALRGVVLGWIPRATVDEVALSSSEGSWQVALRANVSIGAYANTRLRDKQTTELRLPGLDPFHAVFPRPYVATLSSLLAAQDSRTDDFSVDHSLRYHVRRRVELPTNVKMERLAPALNIATQLLGAKRTLTVEGSALIEEFELSLTRGTVEQSAFAGFADKLRQVDEGLLSSVTASMPAPAAAKTPVATPLRK